MATFQRILWPTDFSQASRHALPMVNGLAVQFSSTVDVLHVLSPAPPMATATGQGALAMTEYFKSLEEWARATIKELTASEIASGITAKTTTLIGSAAHEIVRFAEVNDIDLIIIATHGETGFRRLISGSVTEKVVRHASCPVLTVPTAPGDD